MIGVLQNFQNGNYRSVKTALYYAITKREDATIALRTQKNTLEIDIANEFLHIFYIFLNEDYVKRHRRTDNRAHVDKIHNAFRFFFKNVFILNKTGLQNRN